MLFPSEKEGFLHAIPFSFPGQDFTLTAEALPPRPCPAEDTNPKGKGPVNVRRIGYCCTILFPPFFPLLRRLSRSVPLRCSQKRSPSLVVVVLERAASGLFFSP